MTWEVLARLRQERSVVEDLGALALVSASIAGTGEPVTRGGLALTGNYFDLLGVRAARGRLFTPDEASWPSVAPVVVTTHEAQQRDFHGAEDVVGTREVGIRMALGATDRDVRRLLVRGGARPPLVGLVSGLAIGTALSVVAANVVPGVRAADPVAILTVAIVITVLSTVALVVPARALLRGSPMRRLREE